MSTFYDALDKRLRAQQGADIQALYTAVSESAMEELLPRWQQQPPRKRACYLSAEFLMGRLIYSNLYNMGRLEELKTVFRAHKLDPNLFEGVEDAALGNGGLGRLAACFLDSAATHDLPVDGYGIRYGYGLFKQYFHEGFQKETADDWRRFGDPWSLRREEEKVLVHFGDESVWAVPYDMPVVGYKSNTINTLRLFQAEAVQAFDFEAFNRHAYDEAFAKRSRAEAISSVLYPNDEAQAGKRLRLKQQYFFASASLVSMLRAHKRAGNAASDFAQHYAIQLNDTHPTVAIPELMRLLMEEARLPFEKAFAIVRETFAYTNHTIMAEALETWDISLFCAVLPQVYPYVVMLQNALLSELEQRGITKSAPYLLVEKGRLHMARMAIFATHSTNGVAAIHTEILKNETLADWYALYPARFSNKTNGITQRRWLGLCNPGLARFITERIGDGWQKDLHELVRLVPYANDAASLEQLAAIRKKNKEALRDHVRVYEYGYMLDADNLFDIQIKRLHEYKRQLLNAFSIVDIYFALKEGRLKAFAPTTFLFGAKAAPGYYRAKGIIKYINEIARVIKNDPAVNKQLQVLFVQNYDVSYAEKLVPAADVSEQLSTAGTEASGTGNMKFMLNGAVTLGTYDGANIEIVQQAGEENNHIFGARVEELRAIKESYNPFELYEKNPRIRRVLLTLIDGTFSDGGTGMFRALYDSLLVGASWHRPDQYFLLKDFDAYVDAKLRANTTYQDPQAFFKKCLLNTAHAGAFSSDRTIREYAKDIWNI